MHAAHDSWPEPVELVRDSIGLADFASWTDWSLARVGFRPSNCLALVDVCRDELMWPFEEEMARTWGRPFSVGALGAMVLAGRTGLAAALSHVPGEDRRQRFVVLVFPHIGIDADGVAGRVQRRGHTRASTACGALAALREQLLDGGPWPGPPRPGGPDDIEQDYLRERVGGLVAPGSLPSLTALTDLARQAAVEDIARYIDLARGSEPVDVAYISGLVLHLPDGQDRVSGVTAEVRIDDDTIPLPT